MSAPAFNVSHGRMVQVIEPDTMCTEKALSTLGLQPHQAPEGYVTEEGKRLVRIPSSYRIPPVLEPREVEALVYLLNIGVEESAGALEEQNEQRARAKRDAELFPEPDEEWIIEKVMP